MVGVVVGIRANTLAVMVLMGALGLKVMLLITGSELRIRPRHFGRCQNRAVEGVACMTVSFRVKPELVAFDDRSSLIATDRCTGHCHRRHQNSLVGAGEGVAGLGRAAANAIDQNGDAGNDGRLVGNGHGVAVADQAPIPTSTVMVQVKGSPGNAEERAIDDAGGARFVEPEPNGATKGHRHEVLIVERRSRFGCGWADWG